MDIDSRISEARLAVIIWGMLGAWTSGQLRARSVYPGHSESTFYMAKCWVPALPLTWFFLTQKRSWEPHLGITVETTENRECGSPAVQASLRSVRAGSVSQRSNTGISGH